MAVAEAPSGQSVPIRALSLSLLAMSMAVGASMLWPDALLDQQVLACVLALIPAFLLAHYRGWGMVSVLLGGGMVVLSLVHVTALLFGFSFGASPVILLVVAPYLAIALGAGWFGEVRRFEAELRATQLQLIQSEKLESMGRMAAGVAHEVKNPLMTILTGIKVLSKRMMNADEQTRLLLQDMADAVERADKIVGALLGYSRERGLDVAEADLNPTIERSLLLIKHELDTARVSVSTHFDRSLPAMSLDQFKIQQVFINLFTNALHATGHDGAIAVRTFRMTLARGKGVGQRKSDRFAPGETVAVVHIDDNGPGVLPANLDKIFDPFFTTKPTGVGTGLGLSVSRQIVELHGGTIEIVNRSEGGARVIVMFKLGPLEPHDEKATNSARG